MLVDPMLAISGPLPVDEERWSFEPKWDGFRAIVHTDGRRLRVVSRRGTDLAGGLPEPQCELRLDPRSSIDPVGVQVH
jgi:ATP-dependent DNA ligase